MRIPIVSIEWDDAHANGSWFNEKEVNEWAGKPWLCIDTGLLLKETKRHLVFAQRYTPGLAATDEVQYGGLHRIPKTWIRKKLVLGYLTDKGVIRK